MATTLRGWLVRVTAIVVLAGCVEETPADPVSTAGIAAHAYLDSAINIMQRSAFYRRRVDWTAVRAAAHAQAASATTFAATYPAIRVAMAALGDRHSFLVPAPGASSVAALAAEHPIDSIGGELLQGRYGYVHVPTFAQSVPGANAQKLTDSLQTLIRTVDANNPCGWVVDLRQNRGGNMWPMLAGIGPILGNDRPGHFVDADSGISTWFYTNGTAGYTRPDGTVLVLARVTGTAYVLRRTGSAIAVLTAGATASSGEAITIAFRGLPRARSFGAPTAGVPTANSAFPLSDGAVMYLMVALDADRNMVWYDTRIVPDVSVAASGAPRTDDATVAAALAWMASQPVCAS